MSADILAFADEAPGLHRLLLPTHCHAAWHARHVHTLVVQLGRHGAGFILCRSAWGASMSHVAAGDIGFPH
jgi:hypothetical protein